MRKWLRIASRNKKIHKVESKSWNRLAIATKSGMTGT